MHPKCSLWIRSKISSQNAILREYYKWVSAAPALDADAHLDLARAAKIRHGMKPRPAAG
jgi:hypothetical protein